MVFQMKTHQAGDSGLASGRSVLPVNTEFAGHAHSHSRCLPSLADLMGCSTIVCLSYSLLSPPLPLKDFLPYPSAMQMQGLAVHKVQLPMPHNTLTSLFSRSTPSSSSTSPFTDTITSREQDTSHAVKVPMPIRPPPAYTSMLQHAEPQQAALRPSICEAALPNTAFDFESCSGGTSMSAAFDPSTVFREPDRGGKEKELKFKYHMSLSVPSPTQSIPIKVEPKVINTLHCLVRTSPNPLLTQFLSPTEEEKATSKVNGTCLLSLWS